MFLLSDIQTLKTDLLTKLIFSTRNVIDWLAKIPKEKQMQKIAKKIILSTSLKIIVRRSV